MAFLVETDSTLNRPFEERAVGRQVMELLRADRAEGIIVLRPEHIFSSSADAAASLERWINWDMAFYCVDFYGGSPLSLEPGEGSDGSLVLHGLVDLQRRIDAEKSRQRVTNRAGGGSWRGRVPFGFQSVRGVLVEEPNRIERIQRMKRAHRRGQSYRQIAREQGISIATVHRLVRTDLRTLRRMGEQASWRRVLPDEQASGT